MTKKNDISPQNPDLILAQKIGRALPFVDDLKKETDDPFLAGLLHFKEIHAKTQAKHKPDSEKIWNAIEPALHDRKPDSNARIFKFNPALKRYAVAAAILIAGFIGLMMYQLSGPALIKESHASIETIQLTDGSTITLRPYTKLYKSRSVLSQPNYLLEGEAYFEVTPNPDRVFRVETSRAIVQVLGTKFVLSDWGKASLVYLEEGSIRYSSAREKASDIVLEPGQSSRIDDKATAPVVTQNNQNVYKDWLNNELVFQDESALLVFEELEQHYNIRISTSENLVGEKISGSLQLADLPAVLRDLELVLNGRFTQTGNNSFEFKFNN
ncbi:FecR family protein [Gracilimonas mengyeensis]|uniref:FecR family protein n=1 Tax=Gracilimonas mengyeensis TaxID=1302730 RepID=A0A521FF25_9BACT|nr:FecR domain-containing protein [Gracilimonas mengyeensis]SMO94150.1 FecR family protein [Gracilimonas mengyeensis]